MRYFCVLFFAAAALSVAGAEETPLVVKGNWFQAAEAGEPLPENVVIGNSADQERYEAVRRRKEGREAAIAFLRAKGTDRLLAATFQRLLEEQYKAVPGLTAYRQVMENFYRENLGFEALKDDLADLYLKQFTVAELKALTQFYQSDLGKKYAAAEINLAPEISLLFLKRQQEKMPELEKQLQAASK